MKDLYVGFDPDMHHTGIACVDDDGNVLGVWVVKATEKKEREGIVDMIDALSTFFLEDHLPHVVHTVIVESQEISYTAKAGRNPRSIMLLANISGAILYGLDIFYSSMDNHSRQATEFIPPAKWKGQVPKQIHQARVYSALGWKYAKAGKGGDGYCYPTEEHPEVVGIEHINQGDWKHIGDAIGMALWVRDSRRKQMLVQQALASKAVPIQEGGIPLPTSPTSAGRGSKDGRGNKKGSGGRSKRKTRKNRLVPAGGDGSPGNSGSDNPTSVAGSGGGDPGLREVADPGTGSPQGAQPQDAGAGVDPQSPGG